MTCEPHYGWLHEGARAERERFAKRYPVLAKIDHFVAYGNWDDAPQTPLHGIDNPEPTVRFTYDGTQDDPGDEHKERV